MKCTRMITDSITWVGGSDRRLALFENRYPVPCGASYNSYLITDEKNALLDTADAAVSGQFLENVTAALGEKPLHYLVVNHMEPDHCAGIGGLLSRYPDMKIVATAKALQMICQFFGVDVTGRAIPVKENDTLPLGVHTLRFYTAPMIHWPEVMFTYEEKEQLLFSADAFGSFGALGGRLWQDEYDLDSEWLPEARRYYANIVGKYGPQVQAVLKKLSDVSIRMICPLHGPIWRGDFDYLLNKYRLWSLCEPEDRAVCILYGSMYGYTANAADILANMLADKGIPVRVYDVSVTHLSTLIAEAFRCSHLVLAAPTYNNGIFPSMRSLLHELKELNLQNRTVGFVENGSWAPVCAKQMQALIGECKNMTQLTPVVTIRSALADDSLAQLEALAGAVIADF